jgi:hypothetical protein
VPWKLSNGNHIWRLLELKSLMVGKCRLGVDDEVWIHGTILLLPFGFRCIAHARKSALRPSAQAAQSTCRVNCFNRSAGTTLQVQFRCTGGEYRCRDNDARYPNEFVHGVSSEFTKLKHVQARLDRYLNFGNGMYRGLVIFVETTLEGK